MPQTKTLILLNGILVLFCGIYIALLHNTLTSLFSIESSLGAIIIGTVLILGAIYILSITRFENWNQNTNLYSIIYINTFIFFIGLLCLVFNPFDFTFYGNLMLGLFLAIIEFFGFSLLAKIDAR